MLYPIELYNQFPCWEGKGKKLFGKLASTNGFFLRLNGMRADKLVSIKPKF